MTLEQEFVNFRLPKNEFSKLKERILKETYKDEIRKYNEPTKYNIDEIKNVFEGVGIHEEQVYAELRKTKEYHKIKKKEKVHSKEKSSLIKKLKGILPMIGLGFVVSCFVGLGIGGLTYAIVEGNQRQKFQKIYASKLIINADTNKDGFISDKEKEELDYKILKGKGVVIKEEYPSVFGFSHWPTYLDGDDVSIKDMTKFVEEYNPSKE